MVSEVNKAMPMRVDKNTEVTNVGIEYATIIYNYRLVNLTEDQISAEQLASQMKEHLLHSACSNPETRKNLLDKGITIRSSYSDRLFSHITTVNITSADCKHH